MEEGELSNKILDLNTSVQVVRFAFLLLGERELGKKKVFKDWREVQCFSLPPNCGLYLLIRCFCDRITKGNIKKLIQSVLRPWKVLGYLLSTTL